MSDLWKSRLAGVGMTRAGTTRQRVYQILCPDWQDPAEGNIGTTTQTVALPRMQQPSNMIVMKGVVFKLQAYRYVSIYSPFPTCLATMRTANKESNKKSNQNAYEWRAT
jgi:hypothetical protein